MRGVVAMFIHVLSRVIYICLCMCVACIYYIRFTRLRILTHMHKFLYASLLLPETRPSLMMARGSMRLLLFRTYYCKFASWPSLYYNKELHCISSSSIFCLFVNTAAISSYLRKITHYHFLTSRRFEIVSFIKRMC